MNLKQPKTIGLILLCVLLLLGSLTLILCENMTGRPYEEIEAYQAEHPHELVVYTVTITGGDRSSILSNFHSSVTLKDPAQAISLAQQAAYLPKLTEISFADQTPTARQVAAVSAAFPQANIQCAQLELFGQVYPYDATQLNLSEIRSEDLEEAACGLQALPQLDTVLLCQDGQPSQLSLDDAAALHAVRPELEFQYATELFGQLISTDMERVEYFQVPIGDEGLEQFRTLLPMMHQLDYLKLDWCDTSNEAMAQLREDFKDQCKVVWRVFFDQHNVLTDTYKIWATWSLSTSEVECLQYCNEVKYLDLGHNSFMNLDFMKNMTELEMAIVAIGDLHDISGIANCKKLEFLEIFSNRQLTDEDMQYLSGLTNMKYLNISNTPMMRDLSFTDNMPKLRKLWCTISSVPWAETQRVKELHPDCEFVFLSDGDPTDYGWRYTRSSGYTEKTPEYELVCQRFGYATWDFARYPKGYLREEITYESLGLTPS